MVGLRQDARRSRSRTAMHRALFELLLDIPLDKITGAMVAERAGVGYSTYFRHYTDVSALVLDAVEILTDALAQAMMPALMRLDGAGAARAFIEAVNARRREVSALTRVGNALRAELRHQVVDRLASSPDPNATRLPRRLAIRIAVASTVELLDWWLNEEPDRSTGEISELLSSLILQPLMIRD